MYIFIKDMFWTLIFKIVSHFGVDHIYLSEMNTKPLGILVGNDEFFFN